MIPLAIAPPPRLVDLDHLAEDFLDRYRRGEKPTLESYTAAYPELADDVRDLFPALLEIERVKSSACGPHDRANSLEAPLARLGDYRILRIIGQGAMGIVYEAVRESLRSRVALKVMHPRYRDHDRYLRRFHVEAKAAARLHHTNIVSVFDYGEADGLVYYAMPLIAGHSLETVLDDVRRLRGEEARRYEATRRADDRAQRSQRADYCRDLGESEEIANRLLAGRFGAAIWANPDDDAWGTAETCTDLQRTVELPAISDSARIAARDHHSKGAGSGPPSSLSGPSDDRYHREVARLGAQAADALAYAHKRGVLHRDIKPSNLLLDALGNVWVTDFGLAKLEGGDDLTRSTDVVGTMRYMSPERFRGISNQGGDIYALGATLYELLTLHPVFDEHDQFGLIARITHARPVPPREYDRRIPRDLETIVLKALAKDPADRFASAAGMAAELQRVVENRPIQSRAVPGYERIWRWCKRNPTLAGLNALAAALIVAIAVIASLSAIVLKEQRDEAHRHLIRAHTGEIRAHYNAAEGHRLSRRVGQRFEALDDIASAMALEPAVGGIQESHRLRLRNEAIAAMALPDFRVDREIDLAWAKTRGGGAVFDADLTRFAVTRDDGTVSVRTIADGRELSTLPGMASDDRDRTSCFSADGRYLAMSAREHTLLHVWDLESGRLVVSDPELSKSNVRAWDFQPAGRQLAVGHADGSIAFFELPSGLPTRRWQPRSGGVGTLAFSPDGSRLAFGYGGSKKLLVCDTDSGRLLAELEHGGTIFHAAWNPRKPEVLAAGCEDNVIYLWNTSTRQCIALLQGSPSGGLVVAFHPGGELLVSRGWDAVVRLWDTRAGRQMMTRQSSWGSELFFSRDGRRLAAEVERGWARILELAQGDCHDYPAQPFALREAYAGVAIDDGGRYLAAAAPTRVCLWDLRTGTYLGAIPSANRQVKSLAFDPAGALVVTEPWTLRWPLRSGPGAAACIGPPQLIAPYRTNKLFSMSRDGSVIAIPNQEDGAVVCDLSGAAAPHYLGSDTGVRGVSLSPDGRWAVTSAARAGGGLRLWDARTGRIVHEFPGLPRHAREAGMFSPDGRWLLAASDDGAMLLEVATGEAKLTSLGRPFGSTAFTPDSRLIAVITELGSVALLDVNDGHEFARFEDPEQARANGLAFSRDGAYLAVSIDGRGAARVWDLRTIRHRLAGLGLDWKPAGQVTSDAIELGDVAGDTPHPFRVDRGALDDWLRDHRSLQKALPHGFREELEQCPDSADARHRRGHLLAALGRHAEAVAEFSAVLAGGARNAHLLEARTHARLAAGDYDGAIADVDELLRLTGRNGETTARIAATMSYKAWSISKYRTQGADLANVVVMARRAVMLDPNNHAYRNTLGFALYRAGALAEAVSVLDASSSDGVCEKDGFDLLFLAMAHQRMGHAAEARDRFERARQWRTERPHLADELRTEFAMFEAEARALLKGEPTELPGDVFAPGQGARGAK